MKSFLKVICLIGLLFFGASFSQSASVYNIKQSELELSSVYTTEIRRFYRANPDEVPELILVERVIGDQFYIGYLSKVSMQYHAMEDYYVVGYADVIFEILQ